MISRHQAALAGLCVLLATPARAEPFSFLSGEWLLTVKGNIVAAPSYPGADSYALTPYPSLSLRRPDSPVSFSAPDDALSIALYDGGWIKAGPSARFLGARRASDHRELAGLHDVDWTLEAGGFLELWPLEKLRARMDLRYGFHGHRGVVADVGADWVERVGALTLSGGPRLRLASARFANAYFSVTPAQAALNGQIGAYEARGGLMSAGLAAAATYQWSPQWSTTLHARWDRLTGDAGASPVPRILGSRNQFTLGATVAYTFPVRLR